MKKFKWLTALLLNIVTLSIYSLYMWFVMTKNSNAMAEKYGVKKIMGFIPAVLLGCVTCGIFTIVWYFMFQKQQTELAAASGATLTPTTNFFLLGLITFVPVYSFYAVCTNYNAIVDAYEAA